MSSKVKYRQDNTMLEKLINIDKHTSILFPPNFNKEHVSAKCNVLFHELRHKYHDNYYIAIHYLTNKFRYSLVDYKLYRPNLLRNNEYIDYHQEIHRDYKVRFPNVIINHRIDNIVQLNKKKLVNIPIFIYNILLVVLYRHHKC